MMCGVMMLVPLSEIVVSYIKIFLFFFLIARSIDLLLTNLGTPRHSKADVTLHFRRDLLNNVNSTTETAGNRLYHI